MSEYAAETSEPVDVAPEPDTSVSDDSAFATSDGSWEADYPEQGDDTGGLDNPVLEDDWDDEEVVEQSLPDLPDDSPSDWAEGEIVDVQSESSADDSVENPVLADDWDDEESVAEQPLPDLPEETQPTEVEQPLPDLPDDSPSDWAEGEILDVQSESSADDSVENPVLADDWDDEESVAEQPLPDLPEETPTEVEQPLPDLPSESPAADGDGAENPVLAADWNDEPDLSASGSDSADDPSVEELTEAAQAEAKPTSELKDEYDAAVAEQLSDSPVDPVENPVLADDWDDEESVAEQPLPDLPEESQPTEVEQPLPDLPDTSAADTLETSLPDLPTEPATVGETSGDEIENPVLSDDFQHEDAAAEQSLPDLPDEPQPTEVEQPLPDLPDTPDAPLPDLPTEAATAGADDVEPPVLADDFHDAQSATDVGNWLGDVNPNYTGEFDDPYSVNCGKCAESVFNKFEGNPDVAAAGQGTYTTPEMQDATGVEQVPMSPSEIEQALVDGGPGSHALIGVDWEGGGGHWYNAYYDGNKVWAVDGQTGEISPWPGVDPATVKTWDAGINTK